MAFWRTRNPNEFDPLFHSAMQLGPGLDKLLWQGYTHGGAKAAQKRFRLFRYCLRCYPDHRSAVWEDKLYHRTHLTFNPATHQWKVLLDSKQSALSELKNLEDLE